MKTRKRYEVRNMPETAIETVNIYAAIRGIDVGEAYGEIMDAVIDPNSPFYPMIKAKIEEKKSEKVKSNN